MRHYSYWYVLFPVTHVFEMLDAYTSSAIKEYSTRLIYLQDLKPTNILLELEEPEAVITKYLSGSAPLMMADMVSDKRHVASHFNATSKSTDVPATEIVPTPLISRLKNIKVRIIDLGVCTYFLRQMLSTV